MLAVKGLGGYHLAVDAGSQAAASALRARKHREDKPFALMVADLAAARELCEVDETGESLLASARRPVVLLPRRPGAPVADAVAPGNRQLGIMLPYTPLHHLLLAEVGRPIVLTSGNVSDEPIAYTDGDALARLAGIADAFLTHDRAIHIRTDDSVVRPLRGRETLLRRSRGYAPEPLGLAARLPRPVLACGAELKNTFCLAVEDRAFVSHHIGDLENFETLRSFTDGIAHFRRLFDTEPEVVAYDLHPDYLSTKYALDLDGVDLAGVQHHHAHIASCLADNGEEGPVIGVAFDGTGFGTDGTIWGGEFLLADLAGFERAGHLEPVPMPGGAAAIRQPWRMAAAYLDAAYAGEVAAGLEVAGRNAGRWRDVVAMARRGINAPPTSSAGRLFDAVAALLGVRDTINYEGQAAIELEQLADPAERGAYRASIDPGAAGPGGGPARCGCAAPTWCGRRPRICWPAPRRRSSPPGSTAAWRPPSRRCARRCGSGPGWARWRCPAACSRTCCCSARSWTGWRSPGSGCSRTRGCRPTTAGSASARRWWREPATAAAGAEALRAVTGSELVVEGVGVLAVRADDDLALAADPGQVAGPGGLDDLPGHPRHAVRAARFVLQHEAALAAVQRPVDPLDAHVCGGVLGVNRDDVGLAVAGQIPVERFRDVRPRELHPIAVLVRILRVEAIDVEGALCSAHTRHFAVRCRHQDRAVPQLVLVTSS